MVRKADVPMEERRAACGYEGCPKDSFCKIKTSTGWLNVCEDHYRIYHHAKAEKHCNDMGLDTLEKRRAWLRDQGRLGNKMMAPYLREPGQDDEEAAGQAGR